MARKHPNPIDNPPAASSGEEEEEEEEVVEEEEEEEMQSEEEPLEVEEEEEEGEEEEEEEEVEEEEDADDKEELKTEKNHPQPSKSTPDPQEEEDDDETESDSDPTSPGVSGFTIKEHSKPPPPPPPKTEDNSSSPVLVSCKRPAETNTSKSVAKKAKSENGGGEDKKPTPNRFWSEADEIAILKGMIDFRQDRRLDPTSHSIAFYEFVQDKLSVESSKNQVMDKVRRLKKKYTNYAAKAQNGKDPVFSRPHEHKSYHLSKQIWGGDSTPKKTPSRNKKNSANDNGIATTLLQKEPLCHNNNDQACNVQAGNFSQLYPFLHLSLSKCNSSADMVSKHGADAMASSLKYLNKSELEQLEENWKDQILSESELFSKRAILLQKQIKLTRNCNSQRG